MQARADRTSREQTDQVFVILFLVSPRLAVVFEEGSSKWDLKDGGTACM